MRFLDDAQLAMDMSVGFRGMSKLRLLREYYAGRIRSIMNCEN